MSAMVPFRLRDIEDELRVLDVDLGAALGMAQPRNIRQTITANKAELDSCGSPHVARALITHGKGSQQEVTAYWLNEAQALLLCMLARTPKAAEVRRMLIEAFMQWRWERSAGQYPPAVIQPDPRTRLAMLKARVAQLENRAPRQFLPIQAVKTGGFDRDAHYKWRIMEGIRAAGGAATKTELFKMLPHRFSAAQIDTWTDELIAAGQLSKADGDTEKRSRDGVCRRGLNCQCLFASSVDHMVGGDFVIYWKLSNCAICGVSGRLSNIAIARTDSNAPANF